MHQSDDTLTVAAKEATIQSESVTIDLSYGRLIIIRGTIALLAPVKRILLATLFFVDLLMES